MIFHNDLLVYSFEVAREAIYQYLLVILNQRLEHWFEQDISYSNWNDLHQAIYTAIRDKDVEACKKAYHDMIDRKVDL